MPGRATNAQYGARNGRLRARNGHPAARSGWPTVPAGQHFGVREAGQRVTSASANRTLTKTSLLRQSISWIYSADGRPCDHFDCRRRSAGRRGDVLETRGPPGGNWATTSDLRSTAHGHPGRVRAARRADGRFGRQGGPRLAAAAGHSRGGDLRSGQSHRLRRQPAPRRRAAAVPQRGGALGPVPHPVCVRPEM